MIPKRLSRQMLRNPEPLNPILEAAEQLTKKHKAMTPGELKPINMQDIRLILGEGKITSEQMLRACNIILRQRDTRLAHLLERWEASSKNLKPCDADYLKGCQSELNRCITELRAAVGGGVEGTDAGL